MILYLGYAVYNKTIIFLLLILMSYLVEICESPALNSHTIVHSLINKENYTFLRHRFHPKHSGKRTNRQPLDTLATSTMRKPKIIDHITPMLGVASPGCVGRIAEKRVVRRTTKNLGERLSLYVPGYQQQQGNIPLRGASLVAPITFIVGDDTNHLSHRAFVKLG